MPDEDFLSDKPIMTYLVVGIVAIVGVVGGVVTVVNPEALTFEEYVDALWKLALAAAALGIGRGYLKGKKVEAGAGFGGDTHLYRSVADALRTDGQEDPADPALMLGEEVFDVDVDPANEQRDIHAADEDFAAEPKRRRRRV